MTSLIIFLLQPGRRLLLQVQLIRGVGRTIGVEDGLEVGVVVIDVLLVLLIVDPGEHFVIGSVDDSTPHLMK